MNWRAKNSESEPVKSRAELPAAVIEVQPAFVLAARFSSAPIPRLKRLMVSGLGGGVVSPSPMAQNVLDMDAAKKAFASLAALGKNGGSAGLLLPDGAVRVSILEFDALPPKAKERAALLRWRMKESLGFPPEEARISYQETRLAGGGIELVAVAVKRDILSEYESLLAHLGGGVALALPVTMALLPLLSEAEPGGQLLTHVCCGWVTHALAEGRRLRFWRTRQLSLADEALEVGEVISEAARAAASARDRWGLEISKAWLCSRPMLGDDLQLALSRSLALPVELLQAGASAGAELGPEEQPLADLFAAPLAGLISNAGSVL